MEKTRNSNKPQYAILIWHDEITEIKKCVICGTIFKTNAFETKK